MSFAKTHRDLCTRPGLNLISLHTHSCISLFEFLSFSIFQSVYLLPHRREGPATFKDNTFADRISNEKVHFPSLDEASKDLTIRNRTLNRPAVQSTRGLRNIFKLKTLPRKFSIGRGRINASFPVPPPPPTFAEEDKPDLSLQSKESWFSCHGTPSNPLVGSTLRSALFKKKEMSKEIEEEERSESKKSNVDAFSDSCLLCQVNRCHTVTSDLMTIRDCQFCASHDGGRGGVFFTQMSAEVFLNDDRPLPK